MKAAAALALLAASCALPVAGGWTADPVLHIRPEVVRDAPELARGIQDAARAYCRQGHRCIDVRVGHGRNEVRMTNKMPGDPCTPRAIACCAKKGTIKVIYVRSAAAFARDGETCNRARHDAYNVAAHELGHFLGHEHSSDKRDVMYPTTQCGHRRLPKP